MQVYSEWRGPAIAAALTIALGLAACSDTGGPSSGSSMLTQTQASDLGDEVAHDVDDMAGSPTAGPFGGFPLLPPPGGPPRAPCLAVSPQPPLNSDSDAIPDSVRFDFAGCVRLVEGKALDSLSGLMDLMDPLPLDSSFGARQLFGAFALKHLDLVDPRRSFTMVRNGTREWGASPDTLGLTLTGFITDWTHSGGRTAQHTQDWVAKFTAAVPGTIAPATPLPAGSITVNGTGSWTRMDRTWTVVTSTVAPLAFDPACTAAPRFTAGELHLVVTRDGEVTDVQIVFTGCGTRTVMRTPGS